MILNQKKLIKTMTLMSCALLISTTFILACSEDSKSDIDNLNLKKPIVADDYDRDIKSLLSTSDKPMAKEVDAFTHNLYTEVLKNNINKNIMISPLSVSIALGMTANGSAGTTEDAMVKTLGLENFTLADFNGYMTDVIDSLSDDSAGLNSANSIWCLESFQPLKKSFYEIVTNNYLADIYLLESADKINSWVSAKTENKISKIVRDSDLTDAVMVLVNAIYFKGDWKYPFDEKNTKKGEFHTVSSIEDVDMMHLNEELDTKKGVNYTAVKLPYENDRLAMYLYLPDESTDLESFKDNLINGETGYYTPVLNEDDYTYEYAWTDAASDIYSDFSGSQVDITLPKFSYDFYINLNDVLKDMGMEIAFDSGKADFSNFVEGQNPYISNVLHKTFIDVNETSTEAAATTVVIMDKNSAAIINTVNVTFDRPFFYVIRDDKTDTTLFIGQVVNPNK